MNDASTGEVRTLRIRFVGSGSEYFRIWIVNLLLTLVTLGVYYPFAKLRRLRYFHGCTEVDGHPLEFHGNPWAMLRGYGLVVLLALVYGIAQQSSELAGGVALLVLMAIGPALWHASLRFRLANTGWRGIRFAFTGTMREAYVAAWPAYALLLAGVALGVLSALTAGPGRDPGLLLSLLPLASVLALPWLLCRAKRYQHEHYRFASEQMTFKGRPGQFYGVFLRTLGLSLLLVAALAGLLAVSAPGAFGGGRHKPQAEAMVLYAVLVLVAVLLFQVVLRSYWVSRLQNLVWTRTGNSHLRFFSRLGARRLSAVTARNWLLMLLTLGLYFPFAAVATARLRLEAVTIDTRIDIDRLVADPRLTVADAAGDAAADVLGVDIGL